MIGIIILVSIIYFGLIIFPISVKLIEFIKEKIENVQ